MAGKIELDVLPMFGTLTPPDDWMLRSVSPVQIQACVMKTSFASREGRDEIKFLSTSATAQSSAESLFVAQNSSEFENRLRAGDRTYLLLLVSPSVHQPEYGDFHNLALSYHAFAERRFDPSSSRERLRLGLLKFLSSPDSLIFPPPPEESVSCRRFGQVPVRMFMFKLEDVCCDGNKDFLCEETYHNVRYASFRMPFLRYPYTSSVYVLVQRELDTITAHCVNYLSKVISPPHQEPRLVY